jgi:TonB-dependent receptor
MKYSHPRANEVLFCTLIAAAGSTVLTPRVSHAQDGTPEIENIVVSAQPIRDSLERSLEAQRDAENLVSVMAADTIGRFPDSTAAAALARLPAVAVQRDQGQERYLQVRGAPARWTVVSFDGINVVGAEERIFRFDSVPAAIISSVELNRTLTAEMPAEALAGRANIRTFSALDNPGLKAFADAGLGFVDLGDGPQRQYSGRLSWADDRIGAVLAGSHYFFEQQTDNAEPRYDDVGVNNLRNAKYVIERETNSLSGKLEFAPADGHRLSLSSLYTEFLDHEYRNQYTFNFAQGTGTRTFDSASLTTVPVSGAFEEGDYENSTHITMLNGRHELGHWNLGWDLAYVETKSVTDLPIINQTASPSARVLRPSVQYSIGRDGLPVVSVFETVQAGPDSFTFGEPRARLNQRAFDTETLSPYMMSNETESYTAKVDLERGWTSFGQDATFKVGLQYDDRTATDPGQKALLRPDGTTGSVSLRVLAAELGMQWTPFEFITGERFDEDMNRGYEANYIDNAGMREQLDALIDAARVANANGANIPVPVSNPALANEVAEQVAAAYASNTWRFDRQSLTAGVRVERTSIETQGIAAAGGVFTPLDLDTTRTFVFPSIHWSFDVSDDVKLRTALVTGAARPTFGDQRATVSINDSAGSESVVGGNPELKPERAQGADASIEWYMGPAAILSANGFYRDVEDVLFDSTAVVGDDRYNFGGIDRSGYQYTTTLNGSDGELYGMELAYYHPWDFLPGALSGLGIQSSITFIEGTFEIPAGRDVAFPGTSDRITNIALFYEKYGVTARIGWQHRTEWLDDISGDRNSDLYWDAQERWDLSLRLQMTEQLSVYADVNNLTDELGVRYQGIQSRPYEVEGFGRRYLFGVRATF